jgi:putative DNA primase/helicase
MAVVKKKKRKTSLHLVVSEAETALALFRDKAYERADIGNAEYFAARFGERVRWHTASRTWRCWTGAAWDHDEVEVQRLAVQSVRDRLIGSSAMANTRDQADEVKWVMQSLSKGHLDALLTLASKMHGLHTKAYEWDRDPWLLGVANGVVDLRSGEHRAMAPADLIYRRTLAAFDAGATCPRFLRFLKELFPGKGNSMPAFLQRLFGYGLTGRTTEHVLPVLYGVGRNGKTRFLNAIENVFDDKESGDTEWSYRGRVAFNTFVRRRSADPAVARGDLASLHGRRLVTAVEGDEHAQFDTALIKALTGEEDITARFLYGSPFTFRPCALFALSTNFCPVVRDTSPAFWARLLLIHFQQRFEGRDADTNLGDTLAAERDGILQWLLAGCRAWQQDGLQIPDAVRQASQRYQEESDPLREFVDEECVLEAAASVSVMALHNRYWAWAEHRHVAEADRLQQRRFRNLLSVRFGDTFKQPTHAKLAAFRGVQLRTRRPGDPT